MPPGASSSRELRSKLPRRLAVEEANSEHDDGTCWLLPLLRGTRTISPTLFERAVEELTLTPDKYVHSAQLRECSRFNKNSKFVRETLSQHGASWWTPVSPPFGSPLPDREMVGATEEPRWRGTGAVRCGGHSTMMDWKCKVPARSLVCC